MALGAGSYVMWGLVPLFWKQLQHVSSAEILVFRVLFTVVFTAGILAWLGRLRSLAAIVRDRRTLAGLTVSATLIGGNWWLFIWAVNTGRILETSLGYFINPLMSILLGVWALGERLNRHQQIAVGIAALGVLNQTVAAGVTPWVSLALAGSFALYGLMRKQTAAGSLDGLLVETALIAPVAGLYLWWLAQDGSLAFAREGWGTQILLIMAGPVTAVPLLFFASAVRRVRLSTMGFLQYIAPTLTMLTAVFLYNEPFTAAHMTTFGLIWAALALVTYNLVRRDHSAA